MFLTFFHIGEAKANLDWNRKTPVNNSINGHAALTFTLNHI